MSLQDWLPDDEFKFSVDRDPHVMVGDYRIEPDVYVSDIVRRTWRERLFELPWKPFIRFRRCEVAYIVENRVIVSWATFQKIKAGIK